MAGDLSRFTAGSRLLGQLRMLKHGEAFPLDRQTPAYLVEWFKVRLPFYTIVNSGMLGFWDIYRPTAEEMERLMTRDGDDAQAFRAWQHTVDADWDRYNGR